MLRTLKEKATAIDEKGSETSEGSGSNEGYAAGESSSSANENPESETTQTHQGSTQENEMNLLEKTRIWKQRQLKPEQYSTLLEYFRKMGRIDTKINWYRRIGEDESNKPKRIEDFPCECSFDDGSQISGYMKNSWEIQPPTAPAENPGIHQSPAEHSIVCKNGDMGSGELAAAYDASYTEMFSEWSPWRRCSKRCKQKRVRRCVFPEVCGLRMMRENRPCTNGRCNKAPKPVIQPLLQPVIQPEADDNFRILYHLQGDSPYTEWSDWGPCSKDCISRRTRECRMPDVCGTRVEHDGTLCMNESPQCQRMFRRKTRKSAVTPPVRINPLIGLTCGVSPLAANSLDIRSKLRIIGGRESQQGNWPWQLAVLNKHREPFCGATLLSPSWALTAAHCVRSRLIVRAGEHDLMNAEGTEQESTVLDAYVYPEYSPDTVGHDIALLRLRDPFFFDNYTQPACLPRMNDSLEIDDVGQILGWGKRISTSVYGTDILYQAEVPVVDLKECRTKYQQYKITDKMVCAGFKNGRADSCAGDSGGPLLRQQDDKWTVFGVTSFGDGCGEKGKYGIYTFVPKYVKWINRVVTRYQ